MLAVLGLGVIATASPAYAADRSDLVDPNSISIENTSSADPDDPLNQWDQVDIKFTYSSRGKAHPQANDTFAITLPDSFRTATIGFNLVHPDGTVLGACTTTGRDASVITCTFNDNVTHYSYVEGSAWLRAQASKQVTDESVNFNVNGETVPVDLPGEGGIGPEEPEFPEQDKWGWFTGPDRTNIYWSIFFPGSATGSGDPFVITDTLGPNQIMQQGWALTVHSAPDANGWTTVASSEDTRGVEMSMTDTGFTMAIPRDLIDPSQYYRIEYTSATTTSGEGEDYTNTASFDGVEVGTSVTRYTEGGGNIDGPGYGSIGIQKLALQGDGASAVPADTTFTVQAAYQEAGQNVTKEIALTAGGAAGVLSDLPAGTVVTLSEIKLPAINGIQWGEPTFSGTGDGIVVAADGKSAQVTVADQQTVTISLANTASVVTTTTPPTTAPLTTETTPPGTTNPVTSPGGGTTGPGGGGPGTAPPGATGPGGGRTAHPTLAQTGSNLDSLGTIAAGLVVVGGAITLASRRRNTASK